MKHFFLHIIVIFLLITLHCVCASAPKKEEPFSSAPRLVYENGPGPLYSFGLNVQHKGNFVYRQVYTVTDRKSESIVIFHNHFYYGMTDKLTLIVKQPIILKNYSNGVNGRGLANPHIELETIPYTYEIPSEFRFRITTTGRFMLPITTSKVQIMQTLKTPSFFLGVVESLATQTIFQYAGIGIFLPTTRHGQNVGYYVNTELGFSRSLINDGEVYFGFDLQLNATYQKSQSLYGVLDYTTGGTSIFFGPALIYIQGHIVLQGGVQFLLIEHNKIIPTHPTRGRYAFAASLRY